MNKEKYLWWIIILMFGLLMFGSIFTFYAMADAYDKGYDEGMDDVSDFIVKVIHEDHYIDVYDLKNNKVITLIEYNHSKELCFKILEGVFEND